MEIKDNNKKFYIEKTNNINIDGEIDNIIEDKKYTTIDFLFKKNEKINEISSNVFTNNNKTKFQSDYSKTLKIKIQKIGVNKNKINRNLNNQNELVTIPPAQNNQKDINSINTNINTNLLYNIKINKEFNEENKFLNSINKSNIFKVNLNTSNNRNNNNLLQSYEERGFLYNSNATYFDNDGDFFNEEGFNKNKGRRNRIGEYRPGPDYNKVIGMYNSDINNLSIDKETLKKEMEEIEKIEFQKIIFGGKKSK